MRTNIDIDDALMDQALKAGPFSTKKEAVEAGLRLLARQAAYREVLKWEGQLRWEGDESVDWTAAGPAGNPTASSSVSSASSAAPAAAARVVPVAAEPAARWPAATAKAAAAATAAKAPRKRRARR